MFIVLISYTNISTTVLQFGSTMLPRQLHNSHPVQAMMYHVTKTASKFTSCTSHAVPCYQDSFTIHILYKPCSTVLPRQLHNSHPVQAMQYCVNKTASQFTSCTSHAVPCYQDSFTNPILYKPCSTMLPRHVTILTLHKPCSTMLPRQLHNSHPAQAMQYHVTRTASQFSPCTSHAVPCYQDSFNKLTH